MRRRQASAFPLSCGTQGLFDGQRVATRSVKFGRQAATSSLHDTIRRTRAAPGPKGQEAVRMGNDLGVADEAGLGARPVPIGGEDQGFQSGRLRSLLGDTVDTFSPPETTTQPASNRSTNAHTRSGHG